MEILKLESGQKLRLIPFSKSELIHTEYGYYCNNQRHGFHSQFPDLIKSEAIFSSSKIDIQRTTRYYLYVVYNGELRAIRFGYKLRALIETQINNLMLTNNINKNNPEALMFHNLILNVDVRLMNSYPSYDYSTIEVEPIDGFDETFFNSEQYKVLKNNFDIYLNNLDISRNEKMLDYLSSNNYINPKYNYLLRNLKINKIRENRLNTKESDLWDIIDKNLDKTESFKNLGYDDITNKHQFAINCYVFDINLVDNN